MLYRNNFDYTTVSYERGRSAQAGGAALADVVGEVAGAGRGAASHPAGGIEAPGDFCGTRGGALRDQRDDAAHGRTRDQKPARDRAARHPVAESGGYGDSASAAACHRGAWAGRSSTVYQWG